MSGPVAHGPIPRPNSLAPQMCSCGRLLGVCPDFAAQQAVQRADGPPDEDATARTAAHRYAPGGGPYNSGGHHDVVPHPSWCDAARCTATRPGGQHRGRNVDVRDPSTGVFVQVHWRQPAGGDARVVVAVRGGEVDGDVAHADLSPGGLLRLVEALAGLTWREAGGDEPVDEG